MSNESNKELLVERLSNEEEWSSFFSEKPITKEKTGFLEGYEFIYPLPEKDIISVEKEVNDASKGSTEREGIAYYSKGNQVISMANGVVVSVTRDGKEPHANQMVVRTDNGKYIMYRNFIPIKPNQKGTYHDTYSFGDEVKLGDTVGQLFKNQPLYVEIFDEQGKREAFEDLSHLTHDYSMESHSLLQSPIHATDSFEKQFRFIHYFQRVHTIDKNQLAVDYNQYVEGWKSYPELLKEYHSSGNQTTYGSQHMLFVGEKESEAKVVKGGTVVAIFENEDFKPYAKDYYHSDTSFVVLKDEKDNFMVYRDVKPLQSLNYGDFIEKGTPIGYATKGKDGRHYYKMEVVSKEGHVLPFELNNQK